MKWIKYEVVIDHDEVFRRSTEMLFVALLQCAAIRYLHDGECWIET